MLTRHSENLIKSLLEEDRPVPDHVRLAKQAYLAAPPDPAVQNLRSWVIVHTAKNAQLMFQTNGSLGDMLMEVPAFGRDLAEALGVSLHDLQDRSMGTV